MLYVVDTSAPVMLVACLFTVNVFVSFDLWYMLLSLLITTIVYSPASRPITVMVSFVMIILSSDTPSIVTVTLVLFSILYLIVTLFGYTVLLIGSIVDFGIVFDYINIYCFVFSCCIIIITGKTDCNDCSAFTNSYDFSIFNFSNSNVV